MNENLQLLYSCRVVATLFGCTTQAVQLMCKEGRIPAINIGSVTHPQWRVPLSFLEKAMRGEARWKYPRVFKRLCPNRKKALETLNRVVTEAKYESELDNWEDDDE